ncbi:MAG: anti-sigma factor domain-containing protein [Candidatus Eiseniibacteriota bacterium]
MNEDRFTELAPDYALGLLEGEELEQFERHLASGCATCERELAGMDAVGDALAYSVAVTPVPAALRDRVLAAVEADLAAEVARAEKTALDTAISGTATDRRADAKDGAKRHVPGMPWRPGVPEIKPTYEPSPAPWPPRKVEATPSPKPGFWQRISPALAFAGILAASLSGVYAYRLQGQLALVRADLERVTLENQELARVMDVVHSPRLRIVALGGLKPSPSSQARVLWSPEEKKAVFYAYGLPRPPAGKDYQLWVIEGQTPKSEGVFPVDEQGRATHVLPEVPEPQRIGAFAVTLEPAGGVSQPTGDMYLLGAVTRVN